MVSKITTWILVADGARARVFVNEGVGKGVRELSDRAFVGSRMRGRDIQSDRPGRTYDRAGHGRHAMEPPTDPQEKAESDFLRDVVGWLSEKGHEGAFDRLILIAAPRALGEVRQVMPKPLAQKVTGEIAADLTKSDASEVERRVGDVLAV
jgi:protein required for attachment to host cells